MIRTFTNLLEVLVNPFNDLSDVEYERYFNYAAIWAFGGTLGEEHRKDFSDWWKNTFDDHIDYPADGTVFDFFVDNETHDFLKWSDHVPSYTGTPHQGIPNDAFVHTVHTEQLLHLLGLLTDAGKPVMLVGTNGCGKTAIINERIRTVCSGEVAEVLSLSVYANRFTNARLLTDRLDERLEWKHGRTFVPKGNKRLLCLIDDINLSQTDLYGYQTACELVREHLDDGGFYSPSNHTWRYVKNVTYVTSINAKTTANVPPLSQRMLRHFAVFACPYPASSELQTIFSTLLSTHFFTPESSTVSSSGGAGGAAHHLGIHDDKQHQASVRFDEETLRKVVCSVVKVTVELSERLRGMYLPTSQRCHYVFTTRDLATIFRNMCLSLQPGCNKRNLLLLWQHECFWVYGKRMVNEVDFRRFRQAFVTAVRKQFIDDDQIQTIIRPRAPLFSNLIEQDSGVVTAGMIDARSSANVSEEDAKTDLYRPPARGWKEVKELLERGVDEYNKIHPRIKLALYKTVIEQVCRLSRVIASPHEGANTVLVAEGCPVRCSIIVLLSANLCGFTVYRTSATAPSMTLSARMDQFKADLVSGYTRAGAKGEKMILLLQEEDLVDMDYIVFLTEFIVSGSISHLFTHEEQTTIINSIRTEVTQAGLTYTRDVAWNFFLRTVRNNFRIILITCGKPDEFQHLCREYPAFTNSVNFLWFPHWSKTQLIEHSCFHLQTMEWLSDVERENIAHMLASMHLVLRQQDGGENNVGEYGHVNNTSYEKFVERFISLANEKHSEVIQTQDAVTRTLQQIRHENEIAIKLKKQLEHEMVVLQERKAGTIKILSQIGQDTAITEQQVRVVKNQMEKITHLKKRLPEYQVAHERAVYKAIAIVADTKKLVKLMDLDDLAELRAMSKPALEIEDLLAAIIMLLKSPSADLTWQKGAKRQMANLERFVEELTTFDDFQLPEATLLLVEPYLKKPSFEPQAMEDKTNNSACVALCKWVRGVVRYHRMMISKVKPLHQKVDETTQAVDNAQHKMNSLENKRKALEIRLADLARGFEEATIDKNEQEEKTIRMKKMLDTAAQLRRILRGERQRCQQIFDSHERRLVALPGGCAMAAAFSIFLGPYHHNFRRVMLTVHWPACLRERGIPLVVDSVDGLRGRVIDWSIAFLKTASGASSVYEVDYSTIAHNLELDQSRAHSDDEEEKETVLEKESYEDKPDHEEKEVDESEKASKVHEDGGDDDEYLGEGGEDEDESREVDKTKESEKDASKDMDATRDTEDPNMTQESQATAVTAETPATEAAPASGADVTQEEDEAEDSKNQSQEEGSKVTDNKDTEEADQSQEAPEPTPSGTDTAAPSTVTAGKEDETTDGSEVTTSQPPKAETPTKAESKAPEDKTPPKAMAGSKPKTPSDKSKAPVDNKPKTPSSPHPGASNEEGRNSRPKSKTPTGSKSPSGAKTPTTPRNDNQSGEEEDVHLVGLSKIQEEDGDMDDDLGSHVTGSTSPILTTSQYNRYVRSLIKILVGESTLNDWLTKDFGPRQIENAAILSTSWQRPPMMIDPNSEGCNWLARLNKVMNKRKLISLDMENRSDPHIMASLERAITRGKPVLLKNCRESIDNMIAPLVHHRNTAHEKDMNEEPRMILFMGRRTLCHPDFRFYLSTTIPHPHFNPITASSMTLINFGVSHDTLTEELLTRAFARIKPELYRERVTALKNLQLQKETLYRLSETVKNQVLSGGQEAILSTPKALQFITNVTDAKLQLAQQLAATQNILDDLDLLKDELYPVARRASLLYSLMRSLAAIYPEYHFPMSYFLNLFDEAIGKEFPPEFFSDGLEDCFEDVDSSEDPDRKPRPGSAGSQASATEKQTATGKESTDKGDDETAEGESQKNVQPAETEESISTNAVQKLVHGSDSAEIPTIDLPDTVVLPTEGVEYVSMPTSEVKKLMDSLTSLIYHRVKMCLFEEDRLLFSTLMCLNMKVEAGEDITNEEMSLFLQGNPGLGMQLTLSDFDCRASPPSWLSQEKWEDIMALSVLPGSLDSLCVDFAQNAGSWKAWYDSAYPEKEALPLGKKHNTHDEDKDEVEKQDEGTEKDERQDRGSNRLPSPEPSVLNDFHRLLLLRMLRPDRLPTALLSYTQKHLALYDPEEEVFNVNEVLQEAKSHLGVLVMLPPAPTDSKGHPASRLKMTKSPVEELIDLATAVKIPVERVVMSEGNLVSVEEALDTADKNEGWAIIESIHLSTPDNLSKLIQHLWRIHKSRVNFKESEKEEGEESKFCIWLTAEPNSSLPQNFVMHLLKVAWNAILSFPDLSAKSDKDGEGAVEEKKQLVDLFNPLSPRSYLKTAIVSSLRLIPDETLTSLSQDTPLTKGLVFAVAIIHGVLTARQLFGSVGLARWHPFGPAQMTNAVEIVISQMLRPRDMTEPSLEDLCFAVPNLLYSAMVSEECDKTYIQSLCDHVLTSIYKDPQSEILMGSELIPVPPSTVEPVDFADWFDQTARDKMTLANLQLTTSVERGTNDASSTKFISRLDRMFETQNMEAGNTSELELQPTISIAKLRSALDICLDSLPLLLELGDIPQLLKADFDFPYHCPSIISMSSAESTEMPESIGYVLLQECLWLNVVLCHIRQEVHDLQTSLLGGAGALPKRLLPTVHSLQEEYVPVSWIHPNCQPCTHSLVSWLDDINRRHGQLNTWVRRSMVPTFSKGQLSDNPTIARGLLTKVWLGGLVNPQALLTALRQEKAILSRVGLDEVYFECVVLDQADQEFDMEEGGLFITHLVLENSTWDFESRCLAPAKSQGSITLPCVYLKPVVKRHKDKDHMAYTEGQDKGQDKVEGQQEEKAEEGAEGEGRADDLPPEDDKLPPGMVELPIYMNKSRQMHVGSLPVKCPQPEDNWVLSRAAFILDPGLPDGGCKKSRAYLMLQRLPPMMRASNEGAGEEEEEEEEEEEHDDREEEDEEIGIEESGESTRSQLSYKPMSPKAPPLPEGLGLTKEPPMGEKAEVEGDEKGEKKRSASRTSNVSETLSRGKLEDENGGGRKSAVNGKREREEGGGGKEEEKKEGDEDETTSRGDEPADEALDRQGEEDRGIERKKEDEEQNGDDSGVIDFGKTSDVSKGGKEKEGENNDGEEGGVGEKSSSEVVHPANRVGSASGPKPKTPSVAEKSAANSNAERRATEESKTDNSEASRKTVSQGSKKDPDRGREGAEKPASRQKDPTPPASREKPGSKPASREKAGSKPASREKPGSKPASREKISSREKLASRESQKQGKGKSKTGSESGLGAANDGTTGSGADAPIITQIQEENKKEQQEASERKEDETTAENTTDDQGRGGEVGDDSNGAKKDDAQPAESEERAGEGGDHLVVDVNGGKPKTPQK